MNYTRGRKLDRADILKSAIRSGNITPDGADWLTLRLDPYHDFNRPIAGYPDADCYDTIVSVLNYELDVSKPAGAAGNWDAHVFTMPSVSVGAMYNGSFSAGLNFVESANTFTMGLVNVATDDAGGPLFVVANPVASANFSMQRVADFAEVEAGLSRVIGLGIEIIDTTAQMYKQGSLVAYKMPAACHSSVSFANLNAAGTEQTQGMKQVYTTPPSTVAEAVAYRSSVQWEAKDGCYMVVGQEGVTNPFELQADAGVCFLPTGLIAAGQALSTGETITTAAQVPPLVTSSVPSQNTKRANVSQSGIMLRGLANSATFKIRVRVYVERAPLRSESALIPLATPSAAYDYKALALYSHLVSELPVAVPVSFNAKGDWWRIIVNTIKSIAPAIGTVLAPIIGPEAAVIGNAVGALIPQQQIGKRIPPAPFLTVQENGRKNGQQKQRQQNKNKSK